MPRSKVHKLSDIVSVESEPVSNEQEELETFLDGLGPQGIAEVSLYRHLPTGKQKFVVSGPPGQFTEQYVQATFGGGDYLVRARLDNKWFKSKMFSVESPPGTETTNNHAGSEIERLKLEHETLRLRLLDQEARLDKERQDREQRTHERELALIENRSQGGGTAELINAVKALQDLAGQDKSLDTFDKFLGIAEKINNLRGGSSGTTEGGWLDAIKPAITDAARGILPKVLPFLSPSGPTAPAAGTTPAAIVPGPVVPGGSPSEALPNPVPEAPAPAPSEEEQFLLLKRQALAYILPIARMGRDPGIWVDFAIEQVEASGDPVIARFLQEIQKAESFDKWFTELEKLDSTVITSRPWFQVFFQATREVLSQEGNKESAPA